LVFLVTLIRLLDVQGDVLLVARDAAPFAYVAIAYLSASSYLRASDHSRHRTVRMLQGALVIHIGWVAVDLLAPGFTATLPRLGGARVLEIRSDFDTALLAVLAGVSILRIRPGKIWLNAAVAAASLALALSMQSRAGLLSCFACVLTALLLRSGRKGRITVGAVLAAVAGLLALLALLPSSPAGQRLIVTMGGSTTSREVAHGAQGTTRARMIAWEKVVDYTLDDPIRTVVGVGFGPDFLRSCGADVALGQPAGLRSPHNYLLTTFARLGIVGLVTVSALIIMLLTVAIRTACAGRPDDLTSLCVLLVIAILSVAMFGVILESPFGAAPFFWAGGILLGRDRRRRARRRQFSGELAIRDVEWASGSRVPYSRIGGRAVLGGATRRRP
jgi:O-antigen ligase